MTFPQNFPASQTQKLALKKKKKNTHTQDIYMWTTNIIIQLEK